MKFKTNRPSELSISKPYAGIRNVKGLDKNNANCLRIYCRQYPDLFLFQIRTFQSINDYGRGKPRNMIAHVTLTIKEVESILEYMKSEK